MKIKSKSVKPSQRRSPKDIARRAADKKKQMEKNDSMKAESSEMKSMVQPDNSQPMDSKKPVVNEDVQKKAVNNPLNDGSEVTGEEQ